MFQARPSSGWNVQASPGAANTSNPIREIIETMNLEENPDKKVIPLSIGDPTIFGNLEPCRAIPDSLHQANISGKFYGYQTAAGMESAREAVSEYHRKCTGNTAIQRQDVILASGCSHAIDMSICVLAKPGSNILIPRPGFPLYKTLTSVYGVKYKQYDLLADQNWAIDLKHLESLIDANTAAIVVNNPSNPCGSVFTADHLLLVLELAERHKLPIIADEIYDKFVFSPESYVATTAHSTTTRHSNVENQSSNGCHLRQHRDDSSCKLVKSLHPKSATLDKQPLQQPDDGPPGFVPFIALSSLSKTVPILTCGGISKTCLAPGLRLGWVIINDKNNIFDASVRPALGKLTQRLMGPNSLVQGALADILAKVPDTFYAQTMDYIYRNARLCYERLRLIRGLRPYMPQGSMYLMIRFDEKLFPTINGDLDLTSKLMNEQSVLVLPGKCFDFPNYFRICLTVPTDVMNKALDRIEEFCDKHRVLPQIQQQSNNNIHQQHQMNNSHNTTRHNGSSLNGHSKVSSYVSQVAADKSLIKLGQLTTTNGINGQQAGAVCD